jgi:predicted secreted protein
MPSGKFNGKDMKVYTVSGGIDTLITDTDSSEISFTMSPIDTTTKDSNGWREVIAGLKEGSISISGMVNFSGTNQVDQLVDALVNGTQLTVKFKTTTTGDTTYQWACFVTSVPLTFGQDEAATFTCDLTPTGSPTISTVAA